MRAAKFDYHVHESFSVDARYATVESYINAAEIRGIEEIAFTTHQIITGPFSHFGVQLSEIPEYIDKIHQLDNSTDIKLRVGLEVDYFADKEKQLEALIEEYPFDFVLGSTHFIGRYDVGSKLDAPRFFADRILFEVASEYFDVWRMAIESGLFDVMAHPDYWRRFLYLVKPGPIEFSDYGNVLESIDSLASYGVGIEVNTSGRRHEHGIQYPSREFLEAVLKAGVDKITLGSDSHSPNHLGYWIPEAVDMLREIGFKHISSFKSRKNTFNDINSVVRKVKNK